MKKSYKAMLSLCLALLALGAGLLLPVARAEAQAGAACSWYVKRNAEHKQPSLDPAQAEIEKYSAYYVDRAHHDACEERVVYLTFDAGYENGNVERILDILAEENVSAAFFVLKHLIKHDTQLVARMADEGHLVCNHTMNHRDMTALSEKEFCAEVEGLSKLYANMLGAEMAKYYRPPEGRYSIANLQYAEKLGYKTVFWSFAYADWDNGNQPTPEAAKKKILDNIHNGAVLLLHPTSETNAEILGEVIRTLKSEGYRFGTLDELTGA